MSYRLYVMIRSDLESMTPGKAAAQVAHAASQACWNLKGDTHYSSWANEPSNEFGGEDHYEGFGTTIVLDGGSFVDTLDIDNYSLYNTFKGIYPLQYGVIKDPTYPLRDGKKTHLIDIVTCWWAFTNNETNPEFAEWLKQFNLYDGNHD